MEQSGHWAVDVVQGPPLDLSHDQLDRLGVPLVEFLHLGEHPDPGGQGVFVHLEADMALSGLLRLLFPPVQPQGIARDHIFHCVPLLLRLPQLLLRGGEFRSRLLLPPVQPAELLAHRLVPVQHLLGGGSQSGQQGLGLMGIGCLDRLLPPQLLQFLSQSSRRAQGLLGGGVLLLRLFSGPFQLLVDLCQTGAPLRNLAGEAVLPPLPLLQFLPDAGRILQIVLDAAFQHRNGGLQLPDRGLPALNGKAQPVSLHLFFPHLGR